jgi:hypothetical protein
MVIYLIITNNCLLMHPKFFDRLNCKFKCENNKRIKSWIHSLACHILGVKGCVRVMGWDEWQASHLFTQTYTNRTTSWLVHNWSTFGAWRGHWQTHIHKTQHNSDLGEATTFPLIVVFTFDHRAYTQMSFCPGAPKLESRNSDSCDFGGP